MVLEYKQAATTTMFSPPRLWILLAILAPGARCQHATAVAYSHAVAEETENFEPERADDVSAPYNTTAFASHKCRRFGYSYDEGVGYGYDRVNYAQANDLKSSCKSRASNMHGSYTSKGSCYFAFHKILDDKVPSNRMSVACSDDNLVEESRAAKDDPVEHPVRGWPDTCVGDYSRCYRLDHDEQVLLKFMCSLKLEVPEGATHLSVDCTADKSLLKKMLKNGELDTDPNFDPYLRHQVKERREYYTFIVALSIAACACCFLCLLMVHRYAFKPYLKVLKRNRSDPELAGLTSSDSSRS